VAGLQNSECAADPGFALRGIGPATCVGHMPFTEGQILEGDIRTELQGGAQNFRNPNGPFERLAIQPCRTRTACNPVGDICLERGGRTGLRVASNLSQHGVVSGTLAAKTPLPSVSSGRAQRIREATRALSR